MKIQTILAYLSISLLTPPAFVWAQQYGGGGGPVAYYKLPQSPREVAMGGTGVAAATGVFAPYWNPARMFSAGPEDTSVAFSLGVIGQWNYQPSGPGDDRAEALYANPVAWSGTHRLQAGIRVGFPTGFQRTISRLAFGLSYQEKNLSDVSQTSLVNDEINFVAPFQAVEGMLLLTVAAEHVLSTKVNVGINYRLGYISYTNVDPYAPWLNGIQNAGIDIGMFSPLADSFLIFRDVQTGQMVRTLRDERNTEMLFVAGFSQKTFVGGRSGMCLRTSLDLSAGTFDPFTIAFGLEMPYSSKGITLAIRGGINISRLSNPGASGVGVNSVTTGLGLAINHNLLLNASYQYYLNQDGQYRSLVDSPIKVDLEMGF